MNLDLLKELMIIAIALSVITCAFIQKTKGLFKSSKWLGLYSFIINMGVGIVFCLTFTEISFPTSLWVGGFAFIGADSLYKSLEGKLSSYTDIVTKKVEVIEREDK